MATPHSSSHSLFSENEVKNNPYQLPFKKGPRGAYEATQLNGGSGGLYVRVDMPGVPFDGVKVYKYSETRTVNFTGKAPTVWPCDSSPRVYGGYVVLDRDPTSLDVDVVVKNGCLRMFFSNAEGSLHYLRSNTVNTQQAVSQDDDEIPEVLGDQEECCHDQFSTFQEPTRGVTNMRLHSKFCHCNKGKKNLDSSVSRSVVQSHVNPFLLQGVPGACETKLVEEAITENYLYMRVDLPGIPNKKVHVGVKDDNQLYFGGQGTKEYHLDEGGRDYLGCFYLQCPCCRIMKVEPNMKDGVVRMKIWKKNKDKRLDVSRNFNK